MKEKQKTFTAEPQPTNSKVRAVIQKLPSPSQVREWLKLRKRILLVATGLIVVVCLGAIIFRPSGYTSGDCFNFNATTGIIKGYYDDKHGCDKKVRIPEKIDGAAVKEIAAKAFAAKGLTEVSIPNIVTNIRAEAFADNEIKTVKFGKNVEDIDSRAFANNKIQKLVFPESVRFIKRDAFRGNEIKEIEFSGSNLENIMENAFADNQIEELYLPDSLRYMRGEAFANNRLTAVRIGEKVTNIGRNVFFNNPDLKLENIRIDGDANRFYDFANLVGLIIIPSDSTEE